MPELTTYQDGRGIPYEEPQRQVPTGQDIGSPYDIPPFKFDNKGNIVEPTPTNNGNGLGSLPQNYVKKLVKVITIDLTNIFDDVPYNIPGTLLFWSGQDGGIAGPIKVRLDNFQNDKMTMIFDRGISGIPFSQFYLSNPVAQPGITAEITVVSDSPFDRVGIDG